MSIDRPGVRQQHQGVARRRLDVHHADVAEVPGGERGERLPVFFQVVGLFLAEIALEVADALLVAGDGAGRLPGINDL
jgi:hypothetical protein